jgi:hypothetical protein
MFHDNHIYGFTIEEGEYGAGRIIFEIDHIAEWIELDDGKIGFKVAPATLTFLDVTNLDVRISYRESTAAMQPMSIHGITSTVEESKVGCIDKQWVIELNWPVGEFCFSSSGYKLKLLSDSVKTDAQFLGTAERKKLIASNKSSHSAS